MSYDDLKHRDGYGSAESEPEATKPGACALTDRLGAVQRRPSSQPGRWTLVDQVYGTAANPIQARGGGRLTGEAQVHEAARAGVAGGAETLPYFDELKESFGRHAPALDGATAHRGPEAESAADAMGADAYTTGASVAFAAAPTRELVGHEAAHIVQQRAGVSLKGGIGAAGDPYERQADEVGAAFASGRSAEPILDRTQPAAAGSATTVQRKDAASTSPATNQATGRAYEYYSAHQTEILAAIRQRVAHLPPLPLHANLTWIGGGDAIAAALEQALLAQAGSAKDLALKFRELLYPVDPWRLIDMHRTLTSGRPGESVDHDDAMGSMEWSPVVGDAFAVEVEGHLRESLPRLALRYVAQAEDMPPGRETDVDAQYLVPSHPFDLVVIPLLTNHALVQYTRPAHGHKHGAKAAAPDTEGTDAYKNGLRLVQIEWQGARDPKLWNWLRAEPIDDPRVPRGPATAEEVAATLYSPQDATPHSEYAYLITPAPPFFRVEPTAAYGFPGAQAHAPSHVDPDAGSSTGAVDLAASAIGDDAAAAQAASHRPLGGPHAKARVDVFALAHTLEASAAQLELLNDQLAPWQLYDLIGPAREWVAKHRDNIQAAPPETLATWATIIDAQHSLLFEATGDIGKVLESSTASRAKPGTPEAKPFYDVLRAYAAAVGQSELIESATAQLASARRLEAGLPVALLELSMRESRDTSQQLAASGPAHDDIYDVDPAKSSARMQQDLERNALDLRAQQVSGRPVDALALQEITISNAEHSFRDRMKTLYTTADKLKALADEADEGGTAKLANIGNHAIKQLPLTLLDLQGQTVQVVDDMDARMSAAMGAKDAPADPAAMREYALHARQEILADGEKKLTAYAQQVHLDTLFSDALETINNANRRTRYLQYAEMAAEVLALVGLSVVGGVAGAAAGNAVRGWVLADAAVETVGLGQAAAAELGGWAGAAVTDAAVNSAGQTVLSGGDFGTTFTDNLLTNVVLQQAFAPVHAAAESWSELDRAGMTAWGRAGATAAKVVMTGAQISVDIIAAEVIQETLHGRQPRSQAEAAQWGEQAASMVLGRIVHGRLRQMDEHFQRLAAIDADFKQALLVQERISAQLSKKENPQLAEPLLDGHTELLRRAVALLDDPKVVAKLGGKPADIDAMRDASSQALATTHGAGYQLLRFQFEGLEPLAADESVWSGTREQIDAAIAKAGPDARVLDRNETNNRRRVLVGERVVEFIEVAPVAEPAGKTGSALAPIYSAGSIAAESNRVVGRAVGDASTGEEVLRRLNRGDLAALRDVGAEPPAKVEQLLEWGLGKTRDGEIVVVRGERGAVDWSKLPGVTPLAHTHPRSPTGHLPPDHHGTRRVELSELYRSTEVPLLAREVVLPSAPDVVVMGVRGVGEHLVITPFVVVTDAATGQRWVVEAGPQHGPDRLEFRIVGARLSGHRTATGQDIYHATLQPVFGGEGLPPIEVWATTAPPGEQAGNLYLEEPADSVQPGAAPAAAAGDVVRSTAGDAKAKAAASAPPAERKKVLGTDPKRGYIEHEGEVGALIEAAYGYFERDPSGAGEWIALSGPYEGKSFDLLGIPPAATKYHGDDLSTFLPAVDDHFLKSIDYVVLDERNMTSGQRDTLDKYIDTKWASAKQRLIVLK